jgi:hypothetical protein
MNGTAPTYPIRKLVIELAVVVVAVLLSAALGPFGTYASAPGERLLHWSLFVFGGYLFFRPVIAAGSALALNTGLPRWIAIAGSCLLASLPTTLLVLWVLAGRNVQQISVGSLVILYPQVVVVGATVTVVQLLFAGRTSGDGEDAPELPLPAPSTMAPVGMSTRVEERDAPAPSEDPAPPVGAPLFDLLPPHLGSDLICLENEDHYIRAHTAEGSALILMRMRDAVAQLKGEDGARVHRGWWVARCSVVEVVRRDRAVALRLVNGLEAPVARAMVPTLRENGWL